ncbi:hydroxyacid dehydrogenase [Burkholderia diffusa]|uniref:hydroxyacid dehydrogenase n=1 Tax=Burkholderia diffusa TaxID=488732 RepID=UPI002ABD22B3|nr:hydroxyacid dehydrogenase [Burkholderia diffusa]
MKKILCIQPLHAEALRLLDARPDVTYEVVTDFSRENLLRHVTDANAITVRDALLPADVLDAAPDLQVVSRHGVGYDNIPVDYCTSRGIPVTVVGDVNSNSVAEHTLFLMLAVARSGIRMDAAVRAGEFSARSRITCFELRGRRLLVVGYGRIGQEVATRARAFGMHVSVFDPFAARANFPDVAFTNTLDDGLASADIVTLHVPLVPETRNLIGARELALMPAGAVLINSARGGIVDEDALARSIKDGHLRGAGIDTFAVEPLPADSPLASEQGVVLSPHSAALSTEALIGMGVMAVRNALAGLDGTLDRALVVNRSVLDEVSNASE